jgi:hypothetical protein
MKGDKIIVISNIYIIKGIESDGKGGLAIWLKERSGGIKIKEESEED